jgi:hypothetical protein
VAFEPRGRTETVGAPMLILAAVGAVLIAASVWRIARALGATRALEREWLVRASPLERPDLPLPVFVVDVPYQLVAAIGIVRPRLFISSGVFEACGDAELDAIMAHETGHVSAMDNVRRLILRACPDGLSHGREERALERAWSAAAEDAADRFALGRGTLDVDLASALVAVARIGRTPRVGAIASAFLEDDVERRVRSLLGDRELHSPARVRWLRPAGLVFLLIIVGLAFAPGSLAAVHKTVELGVGFLR